MMSFLIIQGLLLVLFSALKVDQCKIEFSGQKVALSGSFGAQFLPFSPSKNVVFFTFSKLFSSSLNRLRIFFA